MTSRESSEVLTAYSVSVGDAKRQLPFGSGGQVGIVVVVVFSSPHKSPRCGESLDVLAAENVGR